MDEAGEVDSTSVLACGEAAEVFESIEAALNPVAVFVDVDVMGDVDLAVALRRDHGDGVHRGDPVAQVVAVIGFVGKHGVGALPIEKVGSGDDIAGLPWRDAQAQWAAKGIGEHVDLGRQTTSGTPQRLIFGPPSPFAAC